MIKHQGIWLPDGEVHLVDWMNKAGEIVDGKGTYQIKKLRLSTAHCTSFRVAIDVGAHVGMWTMQLAKKFEKVYAFEPVAAHRECFEKNLEGVENVELLPYALGNHSGQVKITSAPSSSGDSYVDGDGDIPLERMDTVLRGLENVDYIKIDTEGHELFVVRGAKNIIRNCSPVIIVEQKPGRAQKFGLKETEAVEFLKARGYRLAQELSGDFIMVPNKVI